MAKRESEPSAGLDVRPREVESEPLLGVTPLSRACDSPSQCLGLSTRASQQGCCRHLPPCHGPRRRRCRAPGAGRQTSVSARRRKRRREARRRAAFWLLPVRGGSYPGSRRAALRVEPWSPSLRRALGDHLGQIPTRHGTRSANVWPPRRRVREELAGARPWRASRPSGRGLCRDSCRAMGGRRPRPGRAEPQGRVARSREVLAEQGHTAPMDAPALGSKDPV